MALWNGIRCQSGQKKKKKKKPPLSLLSVVFWPLECFEPQDSEPKGTGTAVSLISVTWLQNLFFLELKKSQKSLKSYKSIKLKMTRGVIWGARENRDSIVLGPVF